MALNYVRCLYHRYWKQVQLSMQPKKKFVSAINKVQQSLKVISKFNMSSKAGKGTAAAASGGSMKSSSTPVLPSIAGAQSANSSSSTIQGSTKGSVRNVLKNQRDEALDPVNPSILGGISNMISSMGGVVSGNSYSANPDDPQSVGRKQWTQLRVQKVSLLSCC